MNRGILIAFFLLGSHSLSNLWAQGEARYLYIQSEPVRHFELIHAGVVKGASSLGYLILPSLPVGVVEFVLRTEENRTYRVDLTEGDKGLGLRKGADIWYLVDLKSGQMLESVGSVRTASTVDTSDASPFARLLSKAVQDPTLLSNHRVHKTSLAVVQQEPIQTDTAALKKTTPIVASKGSQSDTVLVTASSNQAVQVPLGQAVQLVHSVDSNGVWVATYWVREGERVDTIRVELADEKRKMDTVGKGLVGVVPVGCAAELTESEFLQLRTRMAAAQDEDEMVLLVRRVVRTQCLSVSQIRRLSNVFLYDETRYRFFDAVQGHVTDPVHFPELSSYLSDPVYLRRFRALLER